jgi:vacuolar-type H+-ATPase subunit H
VNDKNPLQRGQLETTTAERLAAIVEAAERAATKVIDDAEAEARRYLAEARAEADQVLAQRLSTLHEQTDSLIAQAEEIRQRSERLLDSLTAAKVRLEAEIGAAGDADLGEERPGARSHLSAVPFEEPPPVAEAPAPPAPPEAPLPPQPAPEFTPPQQDSPAGARLLATQMAVSGNSREEIAARLRNGFQIENTDSILDAILGPKER